MGPSKTEAQHASRDKPTPSPKSVSPIRNVLPSTDPPTSFFIRSGAELEQLTSASASSEQDSSYGVRSLDSTTSDGSTIIQEALQTQELQNKPEFTVSESVDYSSVQASSTYSDHARSRPQAGSSGNSPSRPIPRPIAHLNTTGLLTPQQLYSPNLDTDSAPVSSPKSVSLRSLRLSDDEYIGDDSISQAMTSGGEEEEDEEGIQNDGLDMNRVRSLENSISQPELVMPSIKMPSRRPFTERGRGVGKLKIMVTGAAGVGKTSFIRAVVQSCEDIVHVDPTVTQYPSLKKNSPRRQRSTTKDDSANTRSFVEIQASSRAYPSWWSELDENRVLRRRNSNTETVLERNICFVDTPALNDLPNQSSRSVDNVVQYIEQQFQHNKKLSSLSEAEAMSILTGSCSNLVDLIIYMLEAGDKQSDWEAISRLSRLATVLPILGKADLHSEAEINEFKTRFLEYARRNQEDQFLRQVMGIQDAASRSLPNQAFAVSAAASNDETMDASALMNSEYLQPLVASDLPALVDYVFNTETAAMLRHIATKHFLRRRTESGSRQVSAIPAPIFGPLQPNSGLPAATSSQTPSQVLLQRPNAFAVSSPYLLARLSDHTQREERMAQVRLAQWAAELQKRLRQERQQFRGLQLTEQKQWLIERWEECAAEEEKLRAVEGPKHISLQRARSPGKPARHRRSRSRGHVDVMQWTECGKLILQVIGGCGIIGAAAVWICRITGLGFENGWSDIYFTWWNSGD